MARSILFQASNRKSEHLTILLSMVSIPHRIIFYALLFGASLVIGCQAPDNPPPPPRPSWATESSQWYGGLDGGNWLNLTRTNDSLYMLTSYFVDGTVNWTRSFADQTGDFKITDEFEFVFPTHYSACTVVQDGRKHTFGIAPAAADL